MDDSETDIILKQISLLMIKNKENISTRAFNSCNLAKIRNLYDFLAYYKNKHTFLKLKNLGANTNFELMIILDKFTKMCYEDLEAYLSANSENNHFDLTLDEISTQENLSVRAYNCCKDNRLKSLSKIIAYYQIHKTFKGLPNCGQLTNLQLQKICKKHLKIDDCHLEYMTINKDIDNTPLASSDLSLDELNAQENMSVRAYNVCCGNNLTSLSKILEYYSFSRNFLKLSKIGKLTNEELINICDKYHIVSNDCISNDNEQSDRLEPYQDDDLDNFNKFIKLTFSLFKHKFSPEEKEELADDFANNKFCLFGFIYKMLLNEDFLSERDREILLHYNNFIIESDEDYTLENLGDKFGITRERARQINDKSAKIFKRHLSQFSFAIKHMPYAILMDDIIVINDDIVNDINEFESTNFTKEFFNFAFEVILKNTYEAVNNLENYDLIFTKRKIGDWLDIISFIRDLARKISKNPQTYTMPYEAYLYKFAKNDTSFFENLPYLKNICEKIVYDYFRLYVDCDENIVVLKHTKKKRHEYIREILQENGNPLTLNEIYDSLISILPEVANLPQSSIRADIHRFSDLFASIRGGKDRVSKYTLKSWEETRFDVKGGTIRGLVIEILSMHDTPLHMNDIEKYVNQFRDTNSQNIHANIRFDEDKRFTFFPRNFIGLSNRNYGIKLSNKRFPGRFIDSAKSILIKNSGSMEYNQFILTLAVKYQLCPEMVKLVIMKEIHHGVFYLSDNIITNCINNSNYGDEND